MPYRLDDLGWSQFERLCQTLLAHRHGVAVEAWGGSADWGRDAWSEGPLAFPALQQPPTQGPFLFQCKFVENAQAIGARRALERLTASLRAEASRIEERTAVGEWTMPRHYVVMTNARIADRTRRQALAPLAAALPQTELRLLPGQDVEALVAGLPEVRLSFPQLLGLADLESVIEGVIDRDLVTRSNDLLHVAAQLKDVYVATSAHAHTVEQLLEHAFVVLAGPPESGKTSIVRMIAVTQAAVGWEIVDCGAGPHVYDRRYRPDRPQVFVADDAFGSTEYRPDLARAWEEALPRVLRSVGPRHWLVWASRAAPFQAALSRISLREEAEDFPEPAEVHVSAGRLTAEEKAMMLYRHARLEPLTPIAVEHLRRNALAIVRSRTFTPRRVRRIAEQLRTLDSGAAPEAVDALIELELRTPGKLMHRAFSALRRDQQLLTYALLDGASTGCFLLDSVWERHRPDDAEPDASVVAAELEGHVLSAADIATSRFWNWAHPSWRDVAIEALRDDAVARRRFLERGGDDAMMLALSRAGGAGERELPLLKLPGDWAAIQRRLPALVPAASESGHDPTSRLLEAIDAARRRMPSWSRELAQLVRATLRAVRDRWAGDKHIRHGDLQTYYALAASVTPPERGPDLDALWERHLATLGTVREVRAGWAREGEVSSWDLFDFDWAFEFFALAMEHDPSSARARDFPAAWERRIDDVVELYADAARGLDLDAGAAAALSDDSASFWGDEAYGVLHDSRSLERHLAYLPAARAHVGAVIGEAERIYDATRREWRRRVDLLPRDTTPHPPFPVGGGDGRMTEEDLSTLFADLHASTAPAPPADSAGGRRP